MIALAAMPSTSVALVVVRSATHGVPNGLAVAAGIVLGDLVFVALALFGMGMLAETLGGLFAVIKYAAGAYLIWMGIGLLRPRATPAEPATTQAGKASLLASTASGLMLTLGDVKAILFYASLFPSLFNVAALAAMDVLVIIAVTMVTVGGVKAAYAVGARQAMGQLRGTAGNRHARTAAGGVLAGAGAYVIARV
ncbi:LysE family translocator [Ectothiorhodospiraceae bacterium WFHF3C12]|nr:LysE family translocator [Ectothiorhodospiraceae bacterium WFHF3C12]